ncbi:MAG: hypothetical protein ACI9TY_001399 [Alphaproteobacteria bacterium]|jgi:hypothetical protein
MNQLNIKQLDYMTVVGANPSNNYSPTEHHNGDAFINWGNGQGIRFFGVIDGAKAPYDYTINGQPNDAFAAQLFAELIKTNFSLMTHINQWENALTACILNFQNTFDIIRDNHPIHNREDFRLFNGSCAFTLAIIDEKTADCIVLSATDCYMCIRKNGKVVNLSNYSETDLKASGRLIEGRMLSDLIDDGMTLDEAHAHEFKRVRGNRCRIYNKCATRNHMGMPVMNGDINLLDCIQVDTFNVKHEKIDAFIAMSDGYAAKHGDIITCAEGALKQGCDYFHFHNIRPLWQHPTRGNVIMSDVTCAVLTYQ